MKQGERLSVGRRGYSSDEEILSHSENLGGVALLFFGSSSRLNFHAILVLLLRPDTGAVVCSGVTGPGLPSRFSA